MPKLIKVQALAKLYKVHRNTITNWMRYYEEEGKELNLRDSDSLKKFKNWCKKRLLELGR